MHLSVEQDVLLGELVSIVNLTLFDIVGDRIDFLHNHVCSCRVLDMSHPDIYDISLSKEDN